MDANKQLTDLERVELTKKSYEELSLGERVTVGDHFIGIVTNSVYEEDGLRAFVITNPNEVTILFKGSYGFVKGNPTTWRDEWLRTNLPILVALLADEKKIPSQLKTAAKLLNTTIHQFKGARFYIYGHSLGSINAQYALANCRHPKMIAGAYLYEGTNIWILLDQHQRAKISKMRHKIFNYVDIYDPVTLGITASHHMVGQLRYIDSEPMQPIKQHMWGGYKFDENGNLKLRDVDDAFLEESMSERKLLTRSNDLARSIERMGQRPEFSKLAEEKLDELQRRFPDHKAWNKLTEIFNKTSFLKDKDSEK
ncbi:DUF2974 domain-containing protein [Lactobacillus hamsteri]|uniref:DUF2974 domain-containing protein n=1 Tax=Lactobacillus hamsteri DSM 5661 = JCM 6256 TaxID=1423754 RepID=A0A0R1YCX6_9LACO|nr:DUF2974 domain-containing protein [Lactobacillus hamsteri]KRM40320.1 hypothetical protein FC39_GL000792 [Lactobacillus hamsteri DSM 5661 = JCM 6256]